LGLLTDYSNCILYVFIDLKAIHKSGQFELFFRSFAGCSLPSSNKRVACTLELGVFCVEDNRCQRRKI
jgi:hypothetical protein